MPARHVLQPRLSARTSVAQQQSAYLCSPNDQTAVHREYHRHHRPFWCSGNYAKNTQLLRTSAFASNVAYHHSERLMQALLQLNVGQMLKVQRVILLALKC